MSLIVHTMQLEDAFCQINANHRMLHLDRSFRSGGCRPTPLWHFDAVLERGDHSITVGQERTMATFPKADARECFLDILAVPARSALIIVRYLR
jgi:hypothetical protein